MSPSLGGRQSASTTILVYATDMEIPIIYEDDDMVVIDKPSGVLVHGDGRESADTQVAGETVADWHVARAPLARGVGEPVVLPDGRTIDRHGVVHRLDQETSGVLVLAKTPEAFLHLKAQFHDRVAKKEYRAFVYGRMSEQRGMIDRKIGRSAKDFRLRSAQRGARGRLRDAETAWECVSATSEYSYLRLLPKTGRRHQLRVHLKALNHPIVGDRLYAPAAVARAPRALGFDRLALHAFTLTLTMPSEQVETFTAPLPASFLHAERLLAEAGS